jgi:transcriptional regulator GlxA family with amidase domain
MKHISILVPKGHFSLTNLEGTHQILSEVNSLCKAMGKPPVFKVELVGLAHETKQRDGLFTVNPDVLIQDVKRTDLIIIPAPMGDPQKAMELNQDFIPWIIQQYKDGAEVASFCIAAFFLAYTGLLNGKHCATHWRFANQFRSMFPEANLVDDKI